MFALWSLGGYGDISGKNKILLKIVNIVLYSNPWVEASAGGPIVSEGLYSPVAKYMYFGTCFKIRI
jgi:hypothetical protein